MERRERVSIVLKYGPETPLRNVAEAMDGFLKAFETYSKGATSGLIVKEFSNGSLMCEMEADPPAWLACNIIADDLASLSKGDEVGLLPDSSRKGLMKIIQNVESLDLSLGAELRRNERLSAVSLSLLEEEGKTESFAEASQAGSIDKIDLRSNTFSIMLANGHRVQCSPALPWINELVAALKESFPRVRVSGEGRYRGNQLLPASIRVRSVKAIGDGVSLNQVVDSIVAAAHRARIDEVYSLSEAALSDSVWDEWEVNARG